MLPESRRDFFRSLVAGGAGVTQDLRGKSLKHRKADKPPMERLYHGPFLIPADVAETLRESPDLHKCRDSKLAARYVDGDQVTWLIKTRIPDHRAMVGEVKRTPDGRIRVHAWSAATPTPTLKDARRLFPLTETELAEMEIAEMDVPMLPPLPDWCNRGRITGRTSDGLSE